MTTSKGTTPTQFQSLRSPAWAKRVSWTVVLLLYIPLASLFLTALFPHGEFHASYFISCFSNERFLMALYRSLEVAVISSILSTIISLFAVGATWNESTKLLDFFSLVAMIMPELVFSLSLLGWFAFLGMRLSLMTVIIAHVTFSLSFSIYIFKSRLSQFENSWAEAAGDLGASALQVLTRVVIPFLKPAIWASFSMCFLLSLDDFLISFFVNGVGSETLPVQLYTSIQKVGFTPELSALATWISLFSGATIFFILRQFKLDEFI